MKIVKGICSVCELESPAGILPPEKYIVNKSKNLCQYHNKKRKAKPIKKKFPKPSGEGALFKQIWDDHEPEERVSFVTKLPLPDQHEMRTYYFSHILTKGSYPELRLNRDNIQFMTLKEHHDWEFAKDSIKDDPKWSHVFELAEKLKEYAKTLRS